MAGHVQSKNRRSWRREVICLISALISLVQGATWADSSPKSVEIIQTQRIEPEIMPLAAVSIHEGQFMFTFAPSLATQARLRVSLASKLFTGVNEIFAGYVNRAQKRMVVLAIIENLSGPQMMSFTFSTVRKDRLRKLTHFAISNLSLEVSAATLETYNAHTASNKRLRQRALQGRIGWLKRRRVRRCPQVRQCLLPPAPFPQPPSSIPSVPRECPSCQNIKVLCGAPPESPTASSPTRFSTTAVGLAPVGATGCGEGMDVQRYYDRDYCELCVGNNQTLIASLGLCDQTVTLEEFRRRFESLRNGLTLETVRRLLTGLQGRDLLRAIVTALENLAGLCGLADEMSHLGSMNWCREHQSCDEAASTIDHLQCHESTKEIIFMILGELRDPSRFPDDQSSSAAKRLTDYLEEEYCTNQYKLGVLRTAEKCICCQTRKGSLSPEQCEACVAASCAGNGSANRGGNSTYVSNVDCAKFEQDAVKAACDDLRDPQKISHACPAYVALPIPTVNSSVLKALTANSNVAPGVSDSCPAGPPYPAPQDPVPPR